MPPKRAAARQAAKPAVAAGSTSTKRQGNASNDVQRATKRTKTATQKSKPVKATASKKKPSKAEAAPINQVPTQILAIYPFGSSEAGELGLGPSVTGTARPRLNSLLTRGSTEIFEIVNLSCGGMHTVALTADNQIVTWGVNDADALGRDTKWDGGMKNMDAESDEDDAELNPYESTPGVIPASCFEKGARFVQVAAGDSCSFALTERGVVYGWGTFRDASGHEEFGYDVQGKLIARQPTPMKIQNLEPITQITCGENHVLALDTKGTVWGWGYHEQNQLGKRLFGRHTEHLRPRRVEISRNKMTYIASGQHHSFAVDHKDNVWAWGLNSYGEAGHSKGVRDDSSVLPYPMKIQSLCGRGVTVLDGGGHHSAAVTGDGQCLVWGRIDFGQLGISFTPDQLQDESLVRHDEFKKPRICLKPTPVPNIGKATYVACGTDHTLFLNTDGLAYSSGFGGSSGLLGLGRDVDEVEVAQRIQSKDIKEKVLTWAGAGGQFSIVAGPAE